MSQSTILSLLKQLIQFPSESSNIKELNNIIDFVEKYFLGTDLFIKRFSHNNKPSIIISNFIGKRADIVLNGHLDVVPAHHPKQLKANISGNKLYARGAGDMKAGCAIMMTLMKDLDHQKIKDKKISLILTTDEEVGGFDGAGYLCSLGYGGDVVIIPDGGSIDEIVMSQKGLFMFDIKSQGKLCHSSRPWLGKNALHILLDCVQEIRSEIQEDSKIHSNGHRGNTVNCNNISTGTDTYNLVPDFASAKIDVRYTETYSLDYIKQKVIKICHNYSLEMFEKVGGDILYTDPDSIEFKKYLSIANKYLDNKIDLVREHGGSDGRFFVSPKTKAIIIHRPTCGDIHGKEEWLYIPDLLKVYNIYKGFLYSETGSN